MFTFGLVRCPCALLLAVAKPCAGRGQVATTGKLTVRRTEKIVASTKRFVNISKTSIVVVTLSLVMATTVIVLVTINIVVIMIDIATTTNLVC